MSSPDCLEPVPRTCEVCHRTDRFLRCAACQAIYYCGRDHQASDRDSHKQGCLAVKKARASLQREELKLRNMPGDMFMVPDVFKNAVGRFWRISETRPYMHARYGLVDALLLNFGLAGGSLGVAQTALEHLLDMLRLCRTDNMGLRDQVPSLLIRLGRDQEAYDFMKWYATTGQDSRYDWGDMDLPFLDVKGADMLESPKGLWPNRMFDVSHSAAVALIKVRALLNVQAIQNAKMALPGTLPPVIVHYICGWLVGSVVEPRRKVLLGGSKEVARLAETIKGQIRQLYKSIQKDNPYFWRSMLDNPASAIAARPGAYSPGTQSEANLILGYSFAAWAETPGAIEMIRSLSRVSSTCI